MELCNKIYNEDHYINIISIKFNGPAILLIFIVPCNGFVLLRSGMQCIKIIIKLAKFIFNVNPSD